MDRKESKQRLSSSDQNVFDILSELEDEYQVYLELAQIKVGKAEGNDQEEHDAFQRDINHPLTLSIK